MKTTLEHLDTLWDVLHAYRDTGALSDADWDDITYAMACIGEALDETGEDIATDETRAYGNN